MLSAKFGSIWSKYEKLTDGRRTDAKWWQYLTWPFGSGELKRRLNQVQRRHSHVSISSMHDDVNNLNKMETITDNTSELSYWKYNH
jgi:DNA-binding response OmpR family regulator